MPDVTGGDQARAEGARDAVALTLRLSTESHERLRRTAFAVRRPISELIREAIDDHHWHAEGIWCDECAPPYPIPRLDGAALLPSPSPQQPDGHDHTRGGNDE